MLSGVLFLGIESSPVSSTLRQDVSSVFLRTDGFCQGIQVLADGSEALGSI